MFTQNKKNEDGLVSIVSVIIIILIITIISLSLVALTRRSLRQSVDEQLSSQAQYAAESGINDAVEKIKSGAITDISTCDEFNNPSYGFSPDLSGDGSVRYSCVLVDQSPSSITTELPKESLKVYPLINSNGTPITDLKITWKRTDSITPSFPLCTPTATVGCLDNGNTWPSNKLSLLRVRLIPFPSTGTDYNSVNSNLIDIVAYPFGVTGLSSAANATNKNNILGGSCSTTTNSCEVTVNSLNGGTNALPGRYYVQLYSYYLPSNVVITGTARVEAVKFSGAQAVIDSTGVAQDVVKRVRASVSFDKVSNLPIYSLGVGDKLCKRFTTNATNTADFSDVGTACPYY